MEGITILSPSYKDLLFSLNLKFFGDTNGTTCVGSDIDDTKVECWTPKRNISRDKFIKADNEIVKGGRELNDVPQKWIISLFDKEIINLK